MQHLEETQQNAIAGLENTIAGVQTSLKKDMQHQGETLQNAIRGLQNIIAGVQTSMKKDTQQIQTMLSKDIKDLKNGIEETRLQWQNIWQTGNHLSMCTQALK